MASDTPGPPPGTAHSRITVDPVAAATSADPATGLRAIRALRELADRLETLQVARARDLGWSWQQVADALEVSRQAVHKKHARSWRDR